ncbi:hypothetical protein IW152_001656 [Coemansia sp. BCRC 34962]|nr:hypothetical protein IW152_001656 [Coemansia sp. BCRC 34962]
MDADASVLSTPLSTLESSPEAEYESRIANLDSTPVQCTTEHFSWRQLTDLSEKLPELQEQFGQISASCMGDCVALGTVRGLVVVADYLGRVKSMLGSPTSPYGAVSAVTFSADYLALIAGYASGYVVVWDWAKGTTVSVSRPLQPSDSPGVAGHPADIAVTSVGFIGASKHRYISSSASGYVLYHHIVRRLLTTMSTVQLSTPSKTADILFEVAPLAYGGHECATDDLGLVAVLTSAHLTIFKTRHGVEQRYRQTCQAPTIGSDAKQRPFTKRPYAGCLSWLPAHKHQRVVTDPATAQVTMPKLAYSWGTSIHVLALELDHRVAANGAPLSSSGSLARLQFEAVSTWEAIEDVVLCQWIDADVLLYMTQSQRMFVFETKLRQETEVCASPPGSIAGQPWVTLATGAEAEPSYAQAISVCRRRVFAVCGETSVYMGRLLAWTERLELLVEQNRHTDAITLAMGFYQGRTGQIVVGLPRQRQDSSDVALERRRHTLVGSKLVELMRAALRQTFGGQHVSDSLMRALASVCVEACLATDNHSLLFGEVFERYMLNPHRMRVYLETIEPFILSGDIARLPPQILNAMVDCYGATPQLVRRLGELLMNLRLSPGEFDIDRVLSSCRQHRLWRTFARVWLSMGDPVAPVVSILAAASSEGGVSTDGSVFGGDDGDGDGDDDDDETPGIVIFDYLDMVVRGRRYPDGKPIKPQTTAEQYSALVTELVLPPVETASCSYSSSELRATFSTLLALLNLGADRLLVTLNHILGDSFAGLVNFIVKPEAGGAPSKHSDRSLRRASQVKSFMQLVVDTFFVLATSADREQSELLTKRQNGLLSSFALTLYVTRFPLIYLTDESVDKWASILLRLDDPSTRAEREYAFELLFKLNPPQSYDSYIEPTRQAGFFRVLESIYCTLEQYDLALRTYLDHPEYIYHRAVFSAIKELAASRHPKALEGIAEFARSNAVELVEVDAESFANTVEAVSSLSHDSIVAALADQAQAQFAYLRALLDPTPEAVSRSPDHQRSAVTVTDERAPPNIGLSDEQHIVVYPFRSLVPDSEQHSNKHPQEYHERYLELMCRFNPGSVLAYLRQHADLSPEPFRLAYVQSICSKHGVSDGLVWVLMRLGDFSGALTTLISQMDQETERMRAAVPATQNEDGGEDEGERASVLGDADRERLVDHLDRIAHEVDGCVSICRAALSKLGKDVAAQSAHCHDPDTPMSSDVAARAQSEYRALVSTQLCDLWLALLRKVLGYLHHASRTLDGLATGAVAMREAWQLVSKRQRWMLQSVLDALIFAASSASSLISLRHIIQQLLASGPAPDSAPSPQKQLGAGRSLGIAEIQHLLAVAVSAYKTEAQLMALTNVLVNYDLFTTFAQLVRSQKQGWHVAPGSAGSSGAEAGLLGRHASGGSPCCNKCGEWIFSDQRQSRAMAGLRKQIGQYYDSSSLRMLDLHVFEDASAQWQWIKLRSASTTYDEFLSSSSNGRGGSNSAQRVVLFKCGHGFHWSCLTGATGDDAAAKRLSGSNSHNHQLACLSCPGRAASI